jgi:hypothetical protein
MSESNGHWCDRHIRPTKPGWYVAKCVHSSADADDEEWHESYFWNGNQWLPDHRWMGWYVDQPNDDRHSPEKIMEISREANIAGYRFL